MVAFTHDTGSLAAGERRVQQVHILLPLLPPTHPLHGDLDRRPDALPPRRRVDGVADGGARHVLRRRVPAHEPVRDIRPPPPDQPRRMDSQSVVANSHEADGPAATAVGMPGSTAETAEREQGAWAASRDASPSCQL